MLYSKKFPDYGRILESSVQVFGIVARKSLETEPNTRKLTGLSAVIPVCVHIDTFLHSVCIYDIVVSDLVYKLEMKAFFWNL